MRSRLAAGLAVVAATTLAALSVTPANAAESTLSAYVTGYSYWDNTPPGTADISHPIVHKKAGGTGTYSDPITVAVGHTLSGGRDILDWPAGTKFYIPNLQRYFIVEDTCGDGPTPQNGPCHKGYPSNASTWLDVYVDGASQSRSVSDACMAAITQVSKVIVNPAGDYKVTPGTLSGNCKEYGDTPVKTSSPAPAPTPSTPAPKPTPKPTPKPPAPSHTHWHYHIHKHANGWLHKHWHKHAHTPGKHHA